MAQNKKVIEKDSIQVREIKMRFVYSGEIRGEWINGLEAWRNAFIAPSIKYSVIRIEFESEEKPPRIRTSINE